MKQLMNFTSAPKRKLVINNKTAWDTKALRRVILLVANEVAKTEGPLRHTMQVTVVYGRKHYSGYAWFHTGRMRLRLPKPTGKCPHCTDGNLYRAIINGKSIDPSPCKTCNGTAKSANGLQLDTAKLAHLFEHELMHNYGFKHETMGVLNNWDHAVPENYPYLDGAEVKVRQPKTQAPVDKTAVQSERIEARIVAWTRKLKRAETALRKLERQRKYYDKKKAAA